MKETFIPLSSLPSRFCGSSLRNGLSAVRLVLSGEHGRFCSCICVCICCSCPPVDRNAVQEFFQFHAFVFLESRWFVTAPHFLISHFSSADFITTRLMNEWIYLIRFSDFRFAFFQNRSTAGYWSYRPRTGGGIILRDFVFIWQCVPRCLVECINPCCLLRWGLGWVTRKRSQLFLLAYYSINFIIFVSHMNRANVSYSRERAALVRNGCTFGEKASNLFS